MITYRREEETQVDQGKMERLKLTGRNETGKPYSLLLIKTKSSTARTALRPPMFSGPPLSAPHFIFLSLFPTCPLALLFLTMLQPDWIAYFPREPITALTIPNIT